MDNLRQDHTQDSGSSHTPAFYAKLEGAVLQGGQPPGAGGQPEAGCKQLQGTAVPAGCAHRSAGGLDPADNEDVQTTQLRGWPVAPGAGVGGAKRTGPPSLQVHPSAPT